MASAVQMLASTADRDRAISVLKASFLEGRLTKDELELRVGDVLTAGLFTDVMALTCDLPVGPFGRLPAHPATLTPSRTSRLAIAAWPARPRRRARWGRVLSRRLCSGTWLGVACAGPANEELPWLPRHCCSGGSQC